MGTLASPWILSSRLVKVSLFQWSVRTSQRESCLAWLSPRVGAKIESSRQECRESHSPSLVSGNSRPRLLPNVLGESVQLALHFFKTCPKAAYKQSQLRTSFCLHRRASTSDISFWFSVVNLSASSCFSMVWLIKFIRFSWICLSRIFFTSSISRIFFRIVSNSFWRHFLWICNKNSLKWIYIYFPVSVRNNISNMAIFGDP